MTKNAIIYIRQSNDNNPTEYLKKQEVQCRAYAEANGYNVLRVHTNVSFENIVDASKNGEFQAVIVSTMDRISRSDNACFMYLSALQENDVDLIWVNK